MNACMSQVAVAVLILLSTALRAFAIPVQADFKETEGYFPEYFGYHVAIDYNVPIGNSVEFGHNIIFSGDHRVGTIPIYADWDTTLNTLELNVHWSYVNDLYQYFSIDITDIEFAVNNLYISSVKYAGGSLVTNSYYANRPILPNIQFSEHQIHISYMIDDMLNSQDVFQFTHAPATFLIGISEVQVPTPEPGTMILMSIGAAGVAFMRRRKMFTTNNKRLKVSPKAL